MELKDIREKIDLIDINIIKLLTERMEIALRASKLKPLIFDPIREKEVFNNIKNQSQGIINPDFSLKLFEIILSESRRLQELKLKLIGFQGEHGAYGHVAANHYNKSFIPIPCLEFADVFESVKTGKFDYGIVPVENSLEGAVTQVNDLLIVSDLHIIAEVNIPITHCLLTLPETNYPEITTIYSHPQALAQCRGFLYENKLESLPFYDTAGAAKMLSEKKTKATAVIASNLCSELYNLKIVKEAIEDHESNFTRFIILSRDEKREDGNKCSLIFSTQHKVGTLYTILKIFADASLNLTRIESRPLRYDPGNYAFFLDFLGSDKDDSVKKALYSVQQQTSFYKFLGCY